MVLSPQLRSHLRAKPIATAVPTTGETDMTEQEMQEHALRIARRILETTEYSTVYEDDDLLDVEPSDAELEKVYFMILRDLKVTV